MSKTKVNGQLNMSLYEMNQQIIAQLKPLTEGELKELKMLIKHFNKNQQSKFYMLLCSEFSYYTVFNKEKNCNEPLEDCLFDCLQDLGEIKTWTNNETDIEIWMKINENIYCFHFFSYDKGVIDFG